MWSSGAEKGKEMKKKHKEKLNVFKKEEKDE